MINMTDRPKRQSDGIFNDNQTGQFRIVNDYLVGIFLEGKVALSENMTKLELSVQ